MSISAYYYSFAPTGVDAIDKILIALAEAGECYHHTADWRNETRDYFDHGGDCPVDWIQNEANRAAARHKELESELNQVRRERDATIRRVVAAGDAIVIGEYDEAYHQLYELLREMGFADLPDGTFESAREALEETK